MSLLEYDLAKSIYKGFKGKLLTGIIRQSVSASSGALDSYGDPIDPVPTDTAVQGFVDHYSAFYRAQAGIPDTDLRVNIFAQSAPDITPGKDDRVRFGTRWYQLRAARTDPATALWDCQAFEIEAP